jgi:RNA polymerase sigma-70 factor (ECF subfamily)
MTAHNLERRTTPEPVDAATNELMILMNRYENQVYAFLVTMLGDRDAALDCAQDTFLRGYQELRRGKSLTGAWLYKVARNRAIDELQRRKRIEAGLEESEERTAHHSEESPQTERTRRALAALPPHEREILYLAEVDGFSSREIGEMLGIRPGAVRMRISRAHKRFRDVYEGLQ